MFLIQIFNISATSLCISALLLHSRKKNCERYPLIFNIFMIVRSNSQLSTSSGHRHDCYKLFYSHVCHSNLLDETTWVCGPSSGHPVLFCVQSFSLAWGCEQHDGLSTFQTTRRLVTETFSLPPNSFSTLFLIKVHNWVWIFSRKQDKRLAFNFPGQALCFNSDFQYLSNINVCICAASALVCKEKIVKKRL